MPADTRRDLREPADGDCEEEIAFAKEELGVNICRQPPGIDLKQDLDARHRPLRRGRPGHRFSNATANLAGAQPRADVAADRPGGVDQLGTDRHPWYPQTRVFSPTDFSELGAR
ncbi:hypothetical protein ACRAWD_15705 [Caulobacter segnis]